MSILSSDRLMGDDFERSGQMRILSASTHLNSVPKEERDMKIFLQGRHTWVNVIASLTLQRKS